VEIHYRHPSTVEKLGSAMASILHSEFIILCIGTDRCIGDSLGPFIGHQLKKDAFPYPVYGTLEQPIHAINLVEKFRKIKERHPHTPILAIDASLGRNGSIGNIQFKKGSIIPGKGVGKMLPAVGDYSLVGIVDTYHQLEELTIHQVRLHLIHQMAQVMVDSLFYTLKMLQKEETNGYSLEFGRR